MFKISWHPLYCHPLPPQHRFPMEKYNLLPAQLLYEGTIEQAQLLSPRLIHDNDILLCHSPNYLHKLNHLTLSPAEVRRTGFPLSKSLIEREKIIMQGTIEAAYHALHDGIGFNLAGGTHHAFTDKGEGFCLLNDMAIAAHYLLKNKLATQILIIDLDVHQGNGTAQIFKEEPHVFTFSMHGKKNYPLHKEQSDLDVALEDGTTDISYIDILHQQLEILFAQVKPDFVFYQAGVDILAEDKLGRLGITMDGCKQRDRLVFEKCQSNRTALAVTMGGGYAADIKTIVNAHANTFRVAKDLYF